MKPVYKTLKRARDLIKKYGWVKGLAGGKSIGNGGGFCPIGAIDAASGDDVSLMLKSCEAFRRHNSIVSIALWNDHSKEEVIRAFNKAIRASR